jgi:hypothetical protein
MQYRPARDSLVSKIEHQQTKMQGIAKMSCVNAYMRECIQMTSCGRLFELAGDILRQVVKTSATLLSRSFCRPAHFDVSYPAPG